MERRILDACMLNRKLICGDDLSASDLEKWAIEELNWCRSKGVELIIRDDHRYPSLLKQCEDAPLLLYYKGERIETLSFDQSISIVGTRLASGYGREICVDIIKSFVKNNYNPIIISGLAYGIDVCAHNASLENSLKTIAVLPCGIDIIYPSPHRGVACKIINNGAIISEYPRGTPPIRRNFIRRNRIIAGLSQATLVVESRIKGGSIITVQLALSYNREVFAVPGRVTDVNSYGNNYLISKNMASIFCNDDTIPSCLNWSEYSPSRSITAQKDLFTSTYCEKELVINLLNANESLDINELIELTKIKFDLVSIILLDLELEGKIEFKYNRYFIK